MKKHIVVAFAFAISTIGFAQKNELKAAEKAIKKNNFAEAKAAITSAESLLSAMDDKLKAKFYFLKAKALYANGAGSNPDIMAAIESFKSLDQNAYGKKKYGGEAGEIKVLMNQTFLKKANSAYEQKDFTKSSKNFEMAYRTSVKDTVYLYNSVQTAVQGKDYDTALRVYNELLDMGYTGIGMQYMATEVESGEEQVFGDAASRDFSVKTTKTHEKPRNVKTKSKVPEMIKNVALIYIEKGENEKAKEALEKAKVENPNDANLILVEANMYYNLGDKDKYKELISRALELDPTNTDLVFNLGVFAAEDKNYESAEKYYKRVIAMDPNYANAYMNMAALLFDKEREIIDKMNKLGTSSADNKKYDEYKAETEKLYNLAVPHLEKVLELKPKNIDAAKTLMNIYSILGMDDKFKALKAKIDNM